MNVSKRSGNQMQVIVRPEIRKGCVWELQFKFSDSVVANMTEFSTNENNAQKLPVLQLTVKSKLIQTELPFAKVGQLLNDGANVQINKANIALLNVKFTSRPRTVFHRHSDVMILLSVIKKGDQIICSDEIELIFRGGTGSVHSADNKKDSSQSQGFVKMEFRDPIPMHGILKGPGDHGPHGHPEGPLFFPGQPMLPRVDGFEGGPTELGWPGENKMIPQQTFEEFMRTQDPMWHEGGVPFQQLHHFHQLAAQQFHHQQQQQFHPQHSQHMQHLHLQHLQHPHLQHPHLQHPHLQHPQQLQMQQLQQQQLQQQQLQLQQQQQLLQPQIQETPSELQEIQEQQEQLEETRQEKGTEEEKPQSAQEQFVHEAEGENDKKRKPVDNTSDDSAVQKKQQRRENNSVGFQSLFFNCLSNMGLSGISSVCATAGAAVYVNNMQSEIVYTNPAFNNFLAETAEVPSDTLQNLKDIQAVFDSLVGDRSSTHDKFVLSQPEKSLNASSDIIQKTPCVFAKQWANLPCGQTVIIGLIVPGRTSLDD